MKLGFGGQVGSLGAGGLASEQNLKPTKTKERTLPHEGLPELACIRRATFEAAATGQQEFQCAVVAQPG